MTKFVAFLKTALKRLAYMGVAVGTGWFFTQGATINGTSIPEDYFYHGGYPSILTLMDAPWFVGFVALVTLVIVVYVCKLAWDFHEIAVHHAQKHMVAHVTLVSALSLAGLFVNKTWWILAIIIAFTNWKALGDAIAAFVKRLKEV